MFLGLCCAMASAQTSPTKTEGAKNESDSTLARNGWFVYAPYGKSLLSDMHPNFVRFELVGNTNNPVYDFAGTGKDFRSTILGCFGVDLPLWQGNFGPNDRYGICVAQIASAHLWMDLFEPVTSPIINTDYRIGMATATFIHRLNLKFVKNYSVAWSPLKHESTHIGDELQIRRVEQGYAIRRADVSYNYTELAVTLNEPEDRSLQCHTFRLGLMLLWSPDKGWYNILESAGDGPVSLAHPRMSPWEAYFQYQYQSPTSRHGFQAEHRQRYATAWSMATTSRSNKGRPTIVPTTTGGSRTTSSLARGTIYPAMTAISADSTWVCASTTATVRTGTTVPSTTSVKWDFP
ncbi:MAG: hypothetical protein IKO66_05275 [Paludibacteraceae bacterium]|nr:hypothetical protein [Paludibacteraceae bacterium]